MKKIFFLAAMLLPMMSFAQKRVMVIADPHVVPQSIIDMEPDFDAKLQKQRKMLDLSEPIWHALLDTALKRKPDLVLIPGDLTRDGEAVSHDTVSAGIHRLEAAGIRTLVIPGNHDLPGENWETLYSGTFDAAINSVKDAGSHSFVAEPFDGITVIGIDGSDGNASIGKLSSATQKWILDQADAAVAKGNLIIAMSHWQILEHFDQVGTLEAACRFNNADALRDKLMHHGVNLVLTGHFHVNGITIFRDTTGVTNDSLVEITTGSPITFPCPYRWMTISEDRKSIAVTTDYIKSLGVHDDFTTYSRDWMHEHTANLIPGLARKFWGKILDAWDTEIAPELLKNPATAALVGLKSFLPQDEAAQVAITQKHLGEPAINMYLFYSEASEARHQEEGKNIKEALYAGMTGMLTEILMGNSVFGTMFFGVAQPYIEKPVESLVQDKTLYGTKHADVTDDLDLILGDKGSVPTGVESVESDALRAVKFIHNGQLYILKGNQIYTPQGQRIMQ